MNPAEVLNLVAGVILTGLGLAVLALRRRSPTALAFGLFAVGLGGLYLFAAAGRNNDSAPIVPHALAWVLLGIGAASLSVVFPTRVRGAETRFLALSACVAVALLVSETFLTILPDAPDHLRVRGEMEGFGVLLFRVLVILANATAATMVFFFPLRARRFAAADVTSARSLGIFAVGIAMFVAGNMASVASVAKDDAPLASMLVIPPALVASTVLWALAARGPHARLCRNVAIASAAIYTAAAILAAFDASLAFPATRLLGALMLGYAVLRGQIEGLDLKVRFAVSKTTLAGVFIAVFFVGSEAAQQFLGKTLGGPYFGIIAAGALVFVLAPLSRMADRLAEKAVPIAAVSGVAVAGLPVSPQRKDGANEANVAAFRHVALRLAADGKISSDDHRALAVLADDLGLGAVAVADVLSEAVGAAGKTRRRR